MIQTLFGSLTEEKKTGFFDRMKQAVTRTRENLAERIEEVVSFGKEIDANTLDDLEATLIAADLGNTTTQEVLAKLRDKADRKQIKDVQELKRLLKDELLAILSVANSRPVSKVEGSPEVILVVGRQRNRQDHHHRQAVAGIPIAGKNVLLCAADTFPRSRHRATRNLGIAHRHRSHQDQTRRRSLGRILRRAAGRGRAQGRLRCSSIPPAGSTPRPA
jgi:fused signal recognition particle receptor